MRIDLPVQVAVIEDDGFQNKLITSLVNKVEGLEAISLRNPLEALDAIERRRIRLVVTDIVMPAMYGDDLIKKAKYFQWNIDFIVITGIENMLVSYRCFNLGAREVFLKPIDPKIFIVSLEAIRDRYVHWNATVDEIVKRKQKKDS